MKDKKPLESKKWIAVVTALLLFLFIFISSLISMCVFQDISGDIISLANVGTASIAALVSAYACGQSVVDWKLHSVNVNEKSREERISKEEKLYNIEYEGEGDITIEENNYENSRYRDRDGRGNRRRIFGR